MIDYLQAARAGYFFERRKRISNATVDVLFRKLRSTKGATARDYFRVRRRVRAGAIFSAICFPFERTPSFLSDEADARETVYGFLLMVEHGNQVAIIKSGLDVPATFRSTYLREVEDQRIERAIARQDAVFEKVSLRNTSVSKLALSSKTLEARDLANAVSSSSASRFVPTRYNLRRPDGAYSATPSTGRIANRADREGYLALVDWAVSIMDALAAEEGESSDFIRTFARQLNLEQLPAAVQPRLVAVDVPSLTDLLFGDVVEIRLVERDGDDHATLNKDRTEEVLGLLDLNFPVERIRKELHVRYPDGEGKIATLKRSRSRFTLSGLVLPELETIFVEDVTLPVGEDENRTSLARFIDRKQLFTILFDDLSLAYLNGRLYRDEALLGGGDAFLRRLQPCPALAYATSEKGDVGVDLAAFTPNSVFRIVADDVASDDQVLVCDDLGDEWADFIGIRAGPEVVAVSFYHAKHGHRSLSASAFHEAVGQGIKNLGRMALPADVMARKFDKWSEAYRREGVVTQIPRIIRGGAPEEVRGTFDEARLAPDLLKRVYLVASSLSRADVQAVFEGAAAGARPSAHFVQLYWLLTSFFTACAEMGAVGYVICQP